MKICSFTGQDDPLEKELATWYSCLENPMDRGAWLTRVHGNMVTKNQTRLGNSIKERRRDQSQKWVLWSEIQEGLLPPGCSGDPAPLPLGAAGIRLSQHVTHLLSRLCCAVCSAASAVSNSVWPHGPQHETFLCPWDSPGMNWSGLPFPSAGNLPDPGIQPTCPGSPPLAGRFFTAETQGTPHLPSLSFTNSAVKPPLTLYKDTCDYI